MSIQQADAIYSIIIRQFMAKGVLHNRSMWALVVATHSHLN